MEESLKREVSSESVAGDYTLGRIVPAYGQLGDSQQDLETPTVRLVQDGRRDDPHFCLKLCVGRSYCQ